MTDKTHDTERPVERAAAVIPYFAHYDHPSETRLIETTGLVDALGCEIAFTRAERIRAPSPSHLLPGGIRERLADDLKSQNCTLCIVDGALSPVQQRNLERDLNVKVIDRTGLILEIFGLRARTKEGRLQVELARILYERSRLVRTWTHLERQRGGSGFLSGPGETQLEADRRMLDDTIRRLKAGLDEVRKTRRLQRDGRRRRAVPVVALVGYTNAGKSTLFNRLTGADVFAKDMPFATLDPTIRALELPGGREVALVDTVGFITDLPIHLVESFQATLEEVLDADLLLHVRDRSSPEDAMQKSDVEDILRQLSEQAGESLPPLIEVWNKVDRLSADAREVLALAAARSDPKAVMVSSMTGAGLPELLDLLEHELTRGATLMKIVIEPQDGEIRAWLYQNGEVVSEAANETGQSLIEVRLTAEQQGRFTRQFPGRGSA